VIVVVEAIEKLDEVPTVAQYTSASTAAAVHAEQIRTLYHQSLVIAAVNPLNAAIVATVLWPSANHRLLIAWVAAMTAVTLVRAVMRRRYFRAQPSIDEHVVWARHLLWSALATGLLWGLGGATFYDTRGLVPQLLPVFVIGGMVAGASGTLALHLPACLAFTTSAILPVAARMFAEADRVHVAMGLLAIVFGVAMSLLAAHSNRAITEAFRLRVKNQDLLSQLSVAQVSLEQTNQTLEQRVAERGAALERQTEALRDAQRMESVGLLAGGVAHDFNNLLTVVMGNVELLLGDKTRTTHDRSRLEEIQSAAQRGATLVSQLLAFGRRQVMVRHVLDFNAVVADVQPLLTRLIGEHIELVISMAPTPLTVEADPTQLQQTIINLATNARDAMAGGGTLTIETSLVEGTPPGTTLPQRRWVVLTVRDTGIGMDATTRRMAFHPFFTTKGVGKGTGLGLASVHGIVEQSGGHVVVDSEPGHGSCFSVFLPAVRAETSQPAAPPPRPSPAALPHPVMILVAEDEALVRAVTARVLDRAGYTVLEAEDGEQALELVRRHHSTIDLVISDVVMAKLDGRELVRRVTKEWPGLPILLVSGYNPEEISSPNDPVARVELLMKPFAPSELLNKVSSLVRRSAEAQQSFL
jgi:signal transduction histidine kinase/ActR/RegA family two-component response regulator